MAHSAPLPGDDPCYSKVLASAKYLLEGGDSAAPLPSGETLPGALPPALEHPV